MANNLVVMKNGESVQGEILDKTFSFQSSSVGEVNYPPEDISQANLGIFDGDNPDQLLLTDQTEFQGQALTTSITIKLTLGNQQRTIPIAKIKTIKFNFDIDE